MTKQEQGIQQAPHQQQPLPGQAEMAQAMEGMYAELTQLRAMNAGFVQQSQQQAQVFEQRLQEGFFAMLFEECFVGEFFGVFSGVYLSDGTMPRGSSFSAS